MTGDRFCLEKDRFCLLGDQLCLPGDRLSLKEDRLSLVGDRICFAENRLNLVRDWLCLAEDRLRMTVSLHGVIRHFLTPCNGMPKMKLQTPKVHVVLILVMIAVVFVFQGQYLAKLHVNTLITTCCETCPVGNLNSISSSSLRTAISIQREETSPRHEQNTANDTVVQCPADYIVKINDYGFKQKAQVPSLNNRTDYNILILTPFSDSPSRLVTYFQLVCSLTYPHGRISIAFGQDSGFPRESSRQAQEIITKFHRSFRDVTFHELDHRVNKIRHSDRHNLTKQPARRTHMAISRNELLFRAMRNHHDWVVWLDVDLAYIPPNTIQLLLSPNKPIVAPLCLRNTKPYDAFDWNLWRETRASRVFISQQKSLLGEDFVMIENSAASLRKRLDILRDEGNVVRLDGVGGCCLLVNASCHRQGLIFPSLVFDSHLETEGLAKMATKMGIPVYGLTRVQVFHNMTELNVNM